MRNFSKTAWLLAALSGVLQVLIFPTPNLYWLCWIAIAPLLLAVLRARRAETGALLPANTGQAFLLGWLSGVIWWAGSCYWLVYTMCVYGGLDTAAALGLQVLLSLALGAQTGLFTMLLSWVANGTDKRGVGIRRALVFAPFLWVAVELARTNVTGAAWDLLGTAQVDNIPMTRLATVTGVYGLSFEILLVNTAFAAAFLARRHRRRLLFIAAILAAAALQLSVFVQPPPAPAMATARLVQQNIPLDENWTPESYRQTLAELSRKSLPPPPEENTGEPNAELIVWPESPAPLFSNDPLFRTTISQVASQAQAYVIVGELGMNEVPRSQMEPPQLFNSAALVAPDGRWTDRYDKIHLVPFGEYIPFKNLLGFAHKLTREVGDFAPGSRRNVFNLGSYKVGTFICYESVFPGEVRLLAANGAEVFVNISNDEWYGHTSAPYQHLNQARMRAIENQRWVLRDTNTGITASIDPYGRVVEQAPRDLQTALTAPFNIVRSTTFYTRHGDWFAWLCVIVTAVVGVWKAATSNKQ
jgi:apolipoprotein N-acyltransferase